MTMRIKLRKKAQSILEYAVLIGLIAAAVTAMAGYFQSSVSSRLETVRQDLNELNSKDRDINSNQ